MKNIEEIWKSFEKAAEDGDITEDNMQIITKILQTYRFPEPKKTYMEKEREKQEIETERVRQTIEAWKNIN